MTEMHLNPDVYPDPHEFKPERFLGKNEPMTASINRNANERDHFNFGWGRYVVYSFFFYYDIKRSSSELNADTE